MLVHCVFFYLKPDLSPAQRDELFKGAEKLKAITCVEQVYIGSPAPVPERPVIDKAYGLALTVLCKDVAAHNAYQVDPIHKAFVEQFKGCWTRVAVYDSM